MAGHRDPRNAVTSTVAHSRRTLATFASSDFVMCCTAVRFTSGPGETPEAVAIRNFTRKPCCRWCRPNGTG